MAAGHSVVIGLQSTGESHTRQEINNNSANQEEENKENKENNAKSTSTDGQNANYADGRY